MGAKNRIEDVSQEGDSSLGKMLEGPVRDTFSARSLADLEILDSFVNLVTVG